MFEALEYLLNVIRWRFSEKQYLLKKVYFKGRQHKVVGETYHHFYIEDTATSFLKDDYKLNDRFLIKRPKN
jgi:hypothetical protein